MQVRDIMTSSVYSVQSTDSILDAARCMADCDVGMLPVLEGRKLIGVLTDCDIAVRGVAGSIAPAASVRRIMSEPVVTCSGDEEIEDILETMSQEQVRRPLSATETATSSASLRLPTRRSAIPTRRKSQKRSPTFASRAVFTVRQLYSHDPKLEWGPMMEKKPPKFSTLTGSWRSDRRFLMEDRFDAIPRPSGTGAAGARSH